MAKPGKHNANNLSEYLNEMALDEETILSNLAFEPVIIGRQLLENHFGVNDFHGVEANRILLAAMLRLIEEEETLNLANLMYILDDKEINEKKSKLDKVGGEDRISGLFLNPVLKPGVKCLTTLSL